MPPYWTQCPRVPGKQSPSSLYAYCNARNCPFGSNRLRDIETDHVRPAHCRLERQDNGWAGYFARFHLNSNVTPAGVRGFVKFISLAVMDVMIRR